MSGGERAPLPDAGDNATPSKMPWVSNVELATLAVVLAVATWFLVIALDWRAGTALFPLVILVSTILVTIGRILTLLFVRAERVAHEYEAVPVPTDRTEAWRAVRLLGWMAGNVLLVLAIGVILALPVGLLAYLRLEARMPWLRAGLMAAGLCGYLYATFGWLMGMPVLGRGWLL